MLSWGKHDRVMTVYWDTCLVLVASGQADWGVTAVSALDKRLTAGEIPHVSRLSASHFCLDPARHLYSGKLRLSACTSYRSNEDQENHQYNSNAHPQYSVLASSSAFTHAMDFSRLTWTLFVFARTATSTYSNGVTAVSMPAMHERQNVFGPCCTKLPDPHSGVFYCRLRCLASVCCCHGSGEKYRNK